MTADLIALLTAEEAHRLTERIRLKFTSAAQALDSLGALVNEAYERRADAALGYESWQEYADAEFSEQTLGLAPAIRRELVSRLFESGMPQRAIAPAMGVTQQAVQQINQTAERQVTRSLVTSTAAPIDFAAGEVLEASTAVGRGEALAAVDLDLRGGTVPPSPALDVEEQDVPAQPPAPRPAQTITGLDGKTYTRPELKASRRPPLPDSFWRATCDLTKKVESIVRLAGDDRFSQNAEKVALANRSDLIRAIDALQRVVDQLPERTIS